MKNLKKLLALVLSFAMILTMVNLPLVISAEDITENVVTVYVSTLGNDETGDGTTENPYASIANAMEVIEADASATEGKIIILSGSDYTKKVSSTSGSKDVTITNGIDFTTSQHTKMITIAGIENTIYLVGNGDTTYLDPLGPIGFENIKISYLGITPKGQKVVYGKDAINMNANRINTGFAGTVDSEDIYVYYNYGGTWNYCTVLIGSNSKYVVDGDVNFYAESSVHTNQFDIRSGTYNGNVNLTFNGYTGAQKASSAISIKDNPVFNGAVQVILNKGIDRATLFNAASFRKMAPADKTWIMYGEKASDGTILRTTETVGVFKVQGGMVANAYKIDVTATTAEDGTVTYTETQSETATKSVNGLLDLSNAPGEYVVKYTAREIEENDNAIVYVSETGSNLNDGKTPETAFGTIEFAEKWLNASTAEGDKTIEIIGSVDFLSNVAHEDMFIYKAYDSTSVLNRKNNYYNKPDLYGVMTLKGPTTFDGLMYTNPDPKIHTTGYNFVYKNRPVVDAVYSKMGFYVGNYGKDNNNNRENFTLDYAWGYHDNHTVYVGSPTSTQTTVNGADINLVRGQLNGLEFGQNNTFTDDVNIVFDNIEGRGDGYSGIVKVGNNIVFQKSLQIIFNNGNKNWLINRYQNANTDYSPVIEGINANGGTWIIYGETASDGSLLRTTDVAGKYTVEGNLVANAYKVVDGVESETAIQSKNGILDLSGADNAGIYNVRYTTRTAIENSDTVVYVSETGSDLAEGKTLDTAFGTFEFALNWMAKSTAENKQIILSGAEYTFVPTQYDGMLTLSSVDGTTVINMGAKKLLGDLTIDNVTLKGYTHVNGYKFDLTNNALLYDSGSCIVVGSTELKQEEVIISIGGPNNWSGAVRIGADSTTVASNGLKLIVNGGRFNQFFFNNNSKGGTHYGDVNIIINGTITGNSGKISYDPDYNINFDAALQVVFNNNMKSTLIQDTMYDIEAKGGEWFMHSAVGGTLDTTDDAGVFKVTSDLTAKAVNVATGETYFSVNGYLSVPEGEYNIGYIEDENLTKTYYVSENGSDENDGLTTDTAVKTIAKALEIGSNTAKIVILDTAAYDIASAYAKNITISGGTITGDITLYGDLIIENTVIGAQSIDTNGNTLIIGKGVSFANGKPSVVSDEVLLIESGDFANIRIEGNNISKLYAYGATVENVVIATTSTDAIVKVKAEGNANLSFDNAEYKSVQVIFNKTTADVETEAENAWIIGSENSGDSTVDFTDTDGKFTVTTEIEKTPVAVSKDGETVYVADEFDYTYDSIELDDTAATAHKDFINYRGGMPNVAKKLQNNEKLNVVYFGGSVTAGAGLPTNADREVDSWRAKIGAWLTNTFPNSNITNISKAAGESGTYLGAYRIPFLIEQNPDLLIIEYSINDYYYSSTYEDAAARFETIVREIKAALPNCDIITVLVTEKKFYTSSSQGELHTQAQAHDDVAAYYNIPSINVGSALTSQIKYEEWGNYFALKSDGTIDPVHPNAAGYQIYYNCIEEFFSNALLHTEYADDYKFVMPPVKSTYLFDGDRVVSGFTPEMITESEAMGGTGYTFFDRDDGETQGGIQPTTNGGDTFFFKFYGTEVALSFSHVGNDYFPLVSIDGSEDFIPTVTNLAHNPIILAKDLTPGWHTVKLTATSTKIANKVQGIYYVDATKHTLQGECADENFKKATLSLDAGTYNVDYLTGTSTDALTAPEKEGYTFIGWADEEGNIVTELTVGAKLTAVYEENGLPEEDKPFDITGDGIIDGTDLVEVMKALLNIKDIKFFDMNNDGLSDIRDLVALKNKLASITE